MAALTPRRPPRRAGCRAGARARRRRTSADDRGHPGQQVAEVVGQVGVVAGHHPLVGEVAVGAEGEVGQEVVAVAVDAEVGDEVGRGDLVEPRSCDIFSPPTSSHPWTYTCVGRREAGRQQHRRPVHAVEPEDVLADEVACPATTRSNRSGSVP